MNSMHVPAVENDASYDIINNYFYEQGWTDGLPIVPPTESRVAAMLAGMLGRDADELISIVPPKMGRATLRQIAVNAVMAGCKPEYLPVVVAALRAVSEPAYGLAHRQTTTHAGAPLIIVNGPIVQRL
ncbi:MAG TPA: UGSC family (seleno)protein, partial [Burkholderiales bacterium]|nr:UGSC family (seleno)protein [Burkholderiales bacterium]